MKILFLSLLSSVTFANTNNTGHLNLLHLPSGTQIKFNMNYKMYPNFTFQKLKDNCYLGFPKSTKYRRIKNGRSFGVHDIIKTYSATYKPDDMIMDNVVALVLREGSYVSPLKVICHEDTTINEFMAAITRVASVKFPSVEEFETPTKKEIFVPPFATDDYHGEKPGDHPSGGGGKKLP